MAITSDDAVKKLFTSTAMLTGSKIQHTRMMYVMRYKTCPIATIIKTFGLPKFRINWHYFRDQCNLCKVRLSNLVLASNFCILLWLLLASKFPGTCNNVHSSASTHKAAYIAFDRQTGQKVYARKEGIAAAKAAHICWVYVSVVAV